MPNWCYNVLAVSGDKKDISRFKKAAEGPTQTYNDFHRNRGEWPIHDDVRIRSLTETVPEAGPVQVFSFHALFPVPDDIRRFPYDDNSARKMGEAIGEPRHQGGYGWECENWGVKWGASEPSLDDEFEEGNYLSYRFDTAWAPPECFMDKVAKDWPTLSFELDYEEPGMGFAGTMQWEDGVMTSHETREIDDEEEEDYE